MASDDLERRENAVEPLAPAWHTAVLVGLILAVAVTGAVLSRGGAVPVVPGAHGRVAAVYLPMIAVSWALTVYVARVGRRRSALRALLGRGWDSATRAAVDLALAGLVALAIQVSETVAASWQNAAVTILPHSTAERAAWVLVAVSAGFCEEVVYRGYLLTQLSACARRAAAGVALQAVLFGLAHAEQGGAVVARFTLYGVLFGALARWRKSLVPGIVAHVGIDVVSGLR